MLDRGTGVKPLYCLPAIGDTNRYMRLYQAGAGAGANPPGQHPVGIYKQARGDSPVGCPLSLSAGATLPRLGVYARSLPAPPAGGTRSLTGSRRCPRSMTPYHRGSTAPAEGRGMSGKGRFAACGGKGAPVRGPFGGPRPTRPLRPAGHHPAHPGRRRGAARPACCRSRGHVAAKAAPLARPGQVGRQPLRGGTPPQCKAKPLRGGPLARPCIAPPPRRLRRRCSGAARPPQVGAVGPSAPPARPAALRPPPRLRHACGAGSALGGLPAHSPPGVAARRPSLPTAAKPGRRLRPAALPLRGAAIYTPRAKVATPCGLLLPTAHGARLGRGGTPPAGGTATPANAGQG